MGAVFWAVKVVASLPLGFSKHSERSFGPALARQPTSVAASAGEGLL